MQNQQQRKQENKSINRIFFKFYSSLEYGDAMKKENIYKQLRESTETDDKPALTQEELSEIFKNEGNPLSQSVISKLENQQKEPPTTSFDVLKAYAIHFNVTTDYLLGIRPNATIDEDMIMIGKTTGLTDSSIEVLKKWNTLKNNPKQLIPSYGGGDIDTLNMILEDYYNLSKEAKKNGYYPGYSLFHFIRSYIFSDRFRKEPQDRIRYRYGNYWADLEIGDKILTDGTEKVVDGLDAIGKSGASNYSNKLHVYNTENEKEVYTIDFQSLYENISKQHIIETIDRIKERVRKNNDI